MGVAIYTEEFRQEAVKQVVQGGHAVADVAQRLGISRKSLYTWLRELGGCSLASKNAETVDGLKAELALLKAELKWTKEERDILKKSRGVLCKGIRVRYEFIREQRSEHRVSTMCRILRVHRSGFYAWQAKPESDRARDDQRLT